MAWHVEMLWRLIHVICWMFLHGYDRNSVAWGKKRAAEVGFLYKHQTSAHPSKTKNGCQSDYAQMPSSSSYWLRWQGFSQVQHGKEDPVSVWTVPGRSDCQIKTQVQFGMFGSLRYYFFNIKLILDLYLVTASTDVNQRNTCRLEKSWFIGKWICIRVGISSISFKVVKGLKGKKPPIVRGCLFPFQIPKIYCKEAATEWKWPQLWSGVCYFKMVCYEWEIFMNIFISIHLKMLR